MMWVILGTFLAVVPFVFGGLWASATGKEDWLYFMLGGLVGWGITAVAALVLTGVLHVT